MTILSSAQYADTEIPGKTKFAIENASKTRVVLADQTIHILGGFRNIHIAREAVCTSSVQAVSLREIHGRCLLGRLS